VLHWGVKSLDELQDIIDETMADELACMVREKMLRILSDVADFEEAAEEFERTMTQGAAAAAQRSQPETPTVPDPNEENDAIPERLSGESNRLTSVGEPGLSRAGGRTIFSGPTSIGGPAIAKKS